MVLAVTYPWAPASSYLSSQSVADSRCNPHATPRSSYSRRSPSCRFFLCRAALLCLVLQRHRRLSVPCSRGFSCLSAQRKKENGHPTLGLGRGQTRPHLCTFAGFCKSEGEGAHRGAERAGHRGSLSHRIRTRRHEGRLGLLFGAPLRIPRSRALSIHLTTHLRGLASGRAAGQG